MSYDDSPTDLDHALGACNGTALHPSRREDDFEAELLKTSFRICVSPKMGGHPSLLSYRRS